MTEEVLNEDRIGFSGHEAAGAVTEVVKLQATEAGCGARRMEAAANWRRIHPPSQPSAKDVVATLREISARV